MGKRIKLYKCTVMVMNEKELLLLMPCSKVITEYIFASSKTEAISIFKNKYNTNVHMRISEVKISPGLIIYKNEYNSNIEDNELTLSVERSDNT